MRDGCLNPKTKKSDWNPVKVHAKRVSSRLQKASFLLPLAKSSVLALGLQLSRTYYQTNGLPAAAVRIGVETEVRSVLPAASDDAITGRFATDEVTDRRLLLEDLDLLAP